MSTTNCFKVLWHWEIAGKIVNHPHIDYVQCADSKFDTIRNVLVGNQAVTHGGATFVVDSVANIGPGGIEQ